MELKEPFGVALPGPIPLRPTTAVVSCDALRRNVSAVRSRVGSRKIMAVVKANGYGHDLVPVAKKLLEYGADMLGVAFLEEGVRLRQAGIQAPILVLGGIIGNQVEHFLDHDLEITASSVRKVLQIQAAAEARGKSARVHLKIDTGMERIGVQWDSSEELLTAAENAPDVDVVGVYSHLANADLLDSEATHLQVERFEEALTFYPERGLPMPTRHLANSAGIIAYSETLYDMVRPGLMLYGIYPGTNLPRSVSLAPALSLKTRVVYFKVLRQGRGVSYGHRYIPKSDTRVVTLPVGYGDGYSRHLSGVAEVLIRGRRCPVLGNITMDAMMADVGEGSAYNDDEVVLLGKQGEEHITVEELAKKEGTIPYEVLTRIAERVPRSYIE